MSKYTIEVRFICESAAGYRESMGLSGLDEVLDKARPKIFDFDFPIFDENYRAVLENKILIHNYTKEICCETVGRWKLFLRDKLNLIMPYYNKLYETELLKFNPLFDTDLTEKRDNTSHANADENQTHKNTNEEIRTGKHTLDRTVDDSGSDNRNGSHSNSGNDDYTNNDSYTNEGKTTDNKDITKSEQSASSSDTNVSTNNDRLDLYSDTPQGQVDNLLANTYLTNARHIKDDNHQSTVASANANGSSTEKTVGSGTDNFEHTGSLHHAGSFKDSGTTTDAGEFSEKHVTDEDGTTQNNLNSQQIGTANRNSLTTTTEDYLSHLTGKSSGASYSKLLMEFRQTFLNIDGMILNELDDLFFGLW